MERQKCHWCESVPSPSPLPFEGRGNPKLAELPAVCLNIKWQLASRTRLLRLISLLCAILCQQKDCVGSVMTRPFFQPSFEVKICPRPEAIAEWNTEAVPPCLQNPQPGAGARVKNVSLEEPGNPVSPPGQLTSRSKRTDNACSEMIGQCCLQNDLSARRQHRSQMR